MREKFLSNHEWFKCLMLKGKCEKWSSKKSVEFTLWRKNRNEKKQNKNAEKRTKRVGESKKKIWKKRWIKRQWKMIFQKMLKRLHKHNLFFPTRDSSSVQVTMFEMKNGHLSSPLHWYKNYPLVSPLSLIISFSTLTKDHPPHWGANARKISLKSWMIQMSDVERWCEKWSSKSVQFTPWKKNKNEKK